MAFSPTELAVLEAFAPSVIPTTADAWVCEDEGKVAIGQGSTAERAQESWLAALATALLVDVELRRRAEARDLHPNSPEEGA